MPGAGDTTRGCGASRSVRRRLVSAFSSKKGRAMPALSPLSGPIAVRWQSIGHETHAQRETRTHFPRHVQGRRSAFPRLGALRRIHAGEQRFRWRDYLRCGAQCRSLLAGEFRRKIACPFDGLRATSCSRGKQAPPTTVSLLPSTSPVPSVAQGQDRAADHGLRRTCGRV